MPESTRDIRWGSYKDFEGPWTLGIQRYELPENPSESEKIMSVITATEGGGYDVVNMYDVCLWTVGIIQWCNRAPQHSVDDMLGALFEKDPKLLSPLTDLAAERGYKFLRVDGKFRFVDAKYHVVDTPEMQKKLYFRGSTGAKGEWESDDAEWAKRWCLASAMVWDNAESRRIQVEFTTPRLEKWFAYKSGKKLLEQMPDTPVGRAWRALYLSFAANNPARAAEAVDNALLQGGKFLELWTPQWLANMANHMTFDPGISIYPHRYEKIRPVIEELYGVDLPDSTERLREWADGARIAMKWIDPVELQRALVALGKDIGSAGVDGIVGKKTRAALLEVEKEAGLPKVFQDGQPDFHTLQVLEWALEGKGAEVLDGPEHCA